MVEKLYKREFRFIFTCIIVWHYDNSEVTNIFLSLGVCDPADSQILTLKLRSTHYIYLAYVDERGDSIRYMYIAFSI
jgi:hypothetical protein